MLFQYHSIYCIIYYCRPSVCSSCYVTCRWRYVRSRRPSCLSPSRTNVSKSTTSSISVSHSGLRIRHWYHLKFSHHNRKWMEILVCACPNSRGVIGKKVPNDTIAELLWHVFKFCWNWIPEKWNFHQGKICSWMSRWIRVYNLRAQRCISVNTWQNNCTWYRNAHDSINVLVYNEY